MARQPITKVLQQIEIDHPESVRIYETEALGLHISPHEGSFENKNGKRLYFKHKTAIRKFYLDKENKIHWAGRKTSFTARGMKIYDVIFLENTMAVKVLHPAIVAQCTWLRDYVPKDTLPAQEPATEKAERKKVGDAAKGDSIEDMVKNYM
jgi:hypothetical protein